jgi:hypothetical protein
MVLHASLQPISRRLPTSTKPPPPLFWWLLTGDLHHDVNRRQFVLSYVCGWRLLNIESDMCVSIVLSLLFLRFNNLSCNFLNLAVKQSPQGISCDIFDEHSQWEYAVIEMIHMPHVHSNISITAKLGVINSQFYRFLMLCSCEEFFVSQTVSCMVLLKNKGYGLTILLKRTRGCSVKKRKIHFGISAFGVFSMILYKVL